MKKVLFILLGVLIGLSAMAQPLISNGSQYPPNWDRDYPEYIAVFDGVDDYLSAEILVGPDVAIEMEVLIPAGYEHYDKFFASVSSGYYGMGMHSGNLVYWLANGTSGDFATIDNSKWYRLRYDPNRGFAAMGDSVGKFTARDVTSGDSLFFSAKNPPPITDFLRYEWRYIKIWNKGKLTHYLTPQADGSIGNLKDQTEPVLGSELMTEGDFSNGGAAWTVSGESTVNTGVGRIYSSDGSYSKINASIPPSGFVVSDLYLVEYDIVDVTVAGNGIATDGGFTWPSTLGHHSVIFPADATYLSIKRKSGAVDISIDNISIKKITGYAPKKYYNKSDTTNSEPFPLRYLGNIPDVTPSVSTFNGSTDKTQYNSFDDFDWTSGNDSIINLSFKFRPNAIDQNTTLLSDRTVTYRNFHIYLSDNERFTVQTATAAGTFWATSTSLEPYAADSVYTVNIEIDDHVGVKTVTVSGSFNMSYTYTGDLEKATNSALHIGQRNTSYFNGYIWDINLDDQFYFPLPDLGYGFHHSGGTYTTVDLSESGAIGNLEATYGTQWGNQYGYVYRASTDEVLLNNPFRNEAYALINGDIHYNQLGASTTNYYVNPFAGNDANTGTSMASAWATVQKVNEMQGSIYGGDSVLFIANSEFTEQLIPTKSGSPATKINYGKYGAGANPKFSGFKTLTQADFTNTSGDIWLSNEAVTTNSDVKVLYTDGQVWSKARMPNPDGGSRLGYHMMNAHGNFAWLASDELDAGYDYTGMQIASRKAHWIIDLIRVTSQIGTTLYVDEHNPGYPFKTGGFFFFNDERCVDLDNEWWFEFDTRRLGIQKSGTFTDVKISDKEYLIDLNGVNHLSFTDLDFEGANVSAFYMRNVDGIKIEDCNILYSYDGIKGVNSGNPSRDLLITNNNIKHLMNNGVWLDTDFRQGAITYNQIDTIAPFPGMGGEVDGTYNGLRIQGDSMDIGYNTLVYIGYNPISFNGNESKVHHNFIYWFNHVKDDGSAIYVANTGLVGREIYDNLIMHGIGAPAGYVEKVNPWDAIEESNGIYLDLYATGVDVYNNVVYDVPNMGIFLHLTRYDCNIYNNLVFDARGYNGMVNIQSEIRNNDTVDMTNINVYNNTLIAATENQLAFRIETWRDNLETIGYFDNNTFANPIDSDYVVGYRYPKVSGTQRLKLAAYQDSLPSMEQNSVDPKKTVYMRETFQFPFNPSRTDSLILTFPDTMMNFHYDTIFPGDTFVLQPLKAEVLINAGDILPYRKYYINWSAGNDNNDGLSAPIKSLKGLLALQPKLLPGDTVFFNRGDRWNVATDTLLKIRKSGAEGKPIVYAAYGTGDMPVISGFEAAPMNAIGANLFESSSTVASRLDKPNLVRIDGQLHQRARYPNTGWLSVTESYEGEQIVVPGLSGIDVSGGDLVSRKTREVIDVAQVTYQDGSGLITESTGREYLVGHGVFASNKESFMDADGEWFYNNTTDKLRVYKTNSNFSAEISGADYLVDFQQQQDITFDGLVFEGANISAMWLKSGKRGTIKNCVFRDNFNAIYAMKYTSAGLSTTGYGLVVENNTITNTLNNGLVVESEYGDAKIVNNTIDSTGLLPGLGGIGFNNYIAVRTTVNNPTITDNVITNSGYTAMHVDSLNGWIENNFIDTYCLLKDQQGGLNLGNSGHTAKDNVVINGIGNTSGTTYSSPSAYGIWLKSGHKNMRVEGNAIYNTSSSGIIVYDGQGNDTIVSNAAVYAGDPTFGVLNIQTIDGSNNFRNNVITNNLFGSLVANQPVVRFYTTTNDIANWGAINDNIWSNVKDVDATISYQTAFGGAVTVETLSVWQAGQLHDAGTTDPEHEVAIALNDHIFAYNETESDKTIYWPWEAYDVINDVVLPIGSTAVPPWSYAYLLNSAEVVPEYGPEEMGDPEFNLNDGSWIAYNTATLNYNSGTLEVTSPTTPTGAYQSFTTEVGATYRVEAYTTSGTSGYVLRINNGGVPTATPMNDFVPTDGACIGQFTAISTETCVYMRNSTVGTSYWQSVSVKKVLEP